jgi:hypothetical protein
LGTAAVLLVGLWLRSYWRWDILQRGRKLVLVEFDSNDGELLFAKHVPFTDFGGDFYFLSNAAHNHSENFKPFFIEYGSNNIFAGVPHWFAIGVAAIAAAAPWIRWSPRFSLRTLLIATTLLAIGLCLVAWHR